MNYTNELGLPRPFVEAVKSKHTYKPNRYSVTEVLGGTCEAVLKRRHQSEVTEDVSSMLWAILGTAVHKVLESSESGQEQHQEQWLCVKIDNDGERYELSGIPDLYDEATGTVTDWKVTSVWQVTFGDYEKWRKQLVYYCWMLRQKGHDAHSGHIVAMLRDHSQRKARTERDYPPHPVHTVGWEFTDEDMEKAGTEVAEWFLEVKAQELLVDDELVPCSPECRWHKPDTFAVVKDGNKRAARVLEDLDAASALCDQLADKTGKPHHVEHRIGEDTKCDSYCSVAEFCPYVRRMREAAAAADAPTLALAT